MGKGVDTLVNFKKIKLDTVREYAAIQYILKVLPMRALLLQTPETHSPRLAPVGQSEAVQQVGHLSWNKVGNALAAVASAPAGGRGS